MKPRNSDLNLPRDYERHSVRPGEMYCSRSPLIIQTLLGSCVAACLYDQETGVAGMNHFLLAAPRYPNHQPIILSDSGRFGVQAMELLINDMMRRGARRTHIRAKIFGAASVLDFRETEDFFKIAEINQRFIMEFLETERIPLDAADLGGTKGRIIYFNTKNMNVVLRYISKGRTKTVEKSEKNYWKENISHPEKMEILYF